MQEGSLCAQHCVNALLQGSYFTAVDLADIGRQLDETERATMAEGGLYTDAYQRFLQQPSNNYDDSGFFSIQVLQKALRVWGLELLPLTHSNELAQLAKANPTSQQAYICNFREHWLTVRKLGNQWFNLNSLLTGPELVSDTYLAMFLKQLETEGYSMFVVVGQLPQCEANELLKLCPAVQPIKPKLINPPEDNKKGASSSGGSADDQEFEQALKESRELLDSDDTALQQALKLSMQGYVIEPDSGGGSHGARLDSASASTSANVASTIVTPPADELRKKRLAFLEKGSNEPGKNASEKTNDPPQEISNNSDQKSKTTPHENQDLSASGSESKDDFKNLDQLSEEEMLKRAVEMSMQ